MRGSNGMDAVERVKLMKLIWDSVGTEFASRHELYERNYTGSHENVRIELLLAAQMSGQIQEYKGFAEQCMMDYDRWLAGSRLPLACRLIRLTGQYISIIMGMHHIIASLFWLSRPLSLTLRQCMRNHSAVKEWRQVSIDSGVPLNSNFPLLARHKVQYQ